LLIPGFGGSARLLRTIYLIQPTSRLQWSLVLYLPCEMRVLVIPIESPRLNGEEFSKDEVEHGKAHSDYEPHDPADED
jgi:hypothetical protein